MKKVGIITLYNNNNNYGGIAQAYALNKYISNQGFESEIINYKLEKNTQNLCKYKITPKIFVKKSVNKVSTIIKRTLSKSGIKKYSSVLNKRKEKLEMFRNNIPHSEEYTNNNIKDIQNKYDFFVTGSDQCWNPGIVRGAFVFDFLKDKNKRVFSYAPSIALSSLTEEYRKYMKTELKKYSYISLREKKHIDEFKKLSEKDVELVSDPTLLLEREEWNNITNKRIVKEPYIFCYLLGESISQRKKIKKIAKKNGLKLVTIPFIVGGNKFEYKYEDKNFGDLQMLDISFEDFLSLIKYSEFVITDSFHAVCFSYIFEKEFYIFDRKSGMSTNSRINSLLEMFGLENRMVINDDNFNREKVDYKKVNQNFEPYKLKSIKYLKRALDIKGNN